MALKDLFKLAQFSTVKKEDKRQETEVPDGMFVKCSKCQKAVFIDRLEENLNVCPECSHHERLCADKRIEITADNGSFVEMFKDIKTANPLGFKGYTEKVQALDKDEAIKCGVCEIGGFAVALAVMESNFMMGSMGSVVGERLTRLIEHATKKRLPLVIFTCSGGARMHEGIFSLMQMAKVSAAIERHNNSGLLYITVLTDPTTGGVTASFAMLGDIIISEPRATVGFAGRRVIEGTIGQKLPEEFQQAEFVLQHGFIDLIVDRRDIADTLTKLLRAHNRASAN